MALQPITPHIPNFEEFLNHSRRRRYPNKSTLIYAGDTGDTLYYIITGSVSVLIEDDDGREMVVAYLNPGDFFGEMGLFGQEDRSAWIRARIPNAKWPKLATMRSMNSLKPTLTSSIQSVNKWPKG